MACPALILGNRVDYIHLNEGDSLSIALPNGQERALRLGHVAKDHVAVFIDNEPFVLWLNHRAGMDLAEVKSVRLGVEVTYHHLGVSRYSDSHLGLTTDARLSIAPTEMFHTLPGEHVFPIPTYRWDADKICPYDYDMWLQPVIYGYHLGIDLYARRGEQVVSASDGEVVDVRRFDSSKADDYWGTMLAVKAQDGFLYVYCHMDSFEEAITRGSTIRAGEPIGPVGKMGFEHKAIPPHLHFEMLLAENPGDFRFTLDTKGRFLPRKVRGYAVNPRHYLVEWYERKGRTDKSASHSQI